MSEAQQAAQRAKEASLALSEASLETRNQALREMAQMLRVRSKDICAENERDMVAARDKGTDEPLLDRLCLTEERIEGMASALEDLVALDDPLGKVQQQRTLYNGLELKRVSVPLGVVAMIYEARPNVTADAAGICIKSGNACVLRGGSLAVHSNVVIAETLRDAVARAGLPADSITIIESTDRSETDELLKLRGLVDVLIPRGGAGLIQHCVHHAQVPVIETGTGNCHVYVHASADTAMAYDIVMNAKCRRYGVCNAAETLLVDAAIAKSFLPEMLTRLAHEGVLIHGDETTCECAAWARDTGGRAGGKEVCCVAATQEDWATEYLAPEIAIRCVSGVDEAIDHINRYGTKHSEAIVATDAKAIEAFFNRVDAAAVYANASTAFTDGGQFGLGAEIGISTQKIHARGPFALDALTTYKYLVSGTGQVRA